MTSWFYNAQKHLNQRCKLENMTIWVGCFLGTTSLNNNDMGMASGIIDVRTNIISLIFVVMGQMINPSTSVRRIIVYELLTCRNQRPHMKNYGWWRCRGVLTPMAKGKFILGPNP